MTPLEACTLAAALLNTAGFVFHYASMRSEACYYRLPDRSELVRVAAHRHDRGVAGLGKIIAVITFPADGGHGKPVTFSEVHVRNIVANAIGWYMLRAIGGMPYTGRQPRNTSATNQGFNR